MFRSLFRSVPFFLLALALTLPALAKDTTSSKTHVKGNFVLGVDQITGGCEIRKLKTGAEDFLGFKVLGTYDKEELAKTAQDASPACKNGPRQDEKRASLDETENECQTDARKGRASLMGLLSGLASSASQEAQYIDCMKANGYEAKH